MTTPDDSLARSPSILSYQHRDQAPANGPLLKSEIAGFAIALFVVLAGIAAFVVPRINRTSNCSNEGACRSNLRNIAAGCITFANTHNGHYPDSMQELLSATGMTPRFVICPRTNDTCAAGTFDQQIAALSGSGHCSYVYLGKGVMDSAPATTVLAYESHANHVKDGVSGMNVLFADYRVEWLDAKSAQVMINSVTAGTPTYWPLAKH